MQEFDSVNSDTSCAVFWLGQGSASSHNRTGVWPPGMDVRAGFQGAVSQV